MARTSWARVCLRWTLGDATLPSHGVAAYCGLHLVICSICARRLRAGGRRGRRTTCRRQSGGTNNQYRGRFALSPAWRLDAARRTTGRMTNVSFRRRQRSVHYRRVWTTGASRAAPLSGCYGAQPSFTTCATCVQTCHLRSHPAPRTAAPPLHAVSTLAALLSLPDDCLGRFRLGDVWRGQGGRALSSTVNVGASA
jgi:hypothetical protein